MSHTNALNSQGDELLRVAVTFPLTETFDYRVPDHLAPHAEVGKRILVPFRNQKVTGYILERHRRTQVRGLKEILDVLDHLPLFPPSLVPFFEWMSEYYLYPIGKLIQSALPGGINQRTVACGRLTELGQRALALLPPDSNEREDLEWIQNHPQGPLKGNATAIKAMVRQGWITVERKEKRARIGPLMKTGVRASGSVTLKSILEKKSDLIRAKNERLFLDRVLGSDGMLLSELNQTFKNGPYLVNKWVKHKAIEKYRTPVLRLPTGKVMFPAHIPDSLFGQQQRALNEILEHLDRGGFSTALLYGVTGSGKTEVYARAIEHAIKKGSRAILLVPEIALSVYMEGIFISRLGSRVAVYHSGLSAGERYDQWMRMVRGEVDLVIGARSALFAPLSELGLIIVDEEHEFAYKQEEAPRYHGRDAALVRGKMEQALVLLGSGTPSIQSYHHGLEKKYHLVTMPQRIEQRSLPVMQIVDMKQVMEQTEGDEMISPALHEGITRIRQRGEQAILFLNRRGFHRVHLCKHCGQSLRCTNCDMALTHHLEENRLACHYCGYHSNPLSKCPSCGGEGLKPYGFGTEKLERELSDRYPGIRIARLDRDSTRRKGRTFKILKRFNDHEIDLLVGTQMITKGYDFPDVTLVGVIAADVSLGFPDFRAAERTFQILSQVAGRAGRGDLEGRVIVQTFNPNHYAITASRDHDYDSFFKQEMQLRKQLGYPPFSYMASLRFQGSSQNETSMIAKQVSEKMARILTKWPKRGKEIQLLGPAEAPLAKLRGKYRWQTLIKCRGAALLHYYLREVEGVSDPFLKSSRVSMTVDVDPYQML